MKLWHGDGSQGFVQKIFIMHTKSFINLYSMNIGKPFERRKSSPKREPMGCSQEILSSHLFKKYRDREEKAEKLPRGDLGIMGEMYSALGSQSLLWSIFFDQAMSKSEYIPNYVWLCRQ